MHCPSATGLCTTGFAAVCAATVWQVPHRSAAGLTSVAFDAGVPAVWQSLQSPLSKPGCCCAPISELSFDA